MNENAHKFSHRSVDKTLEQRRKSLFVSHIHEISCGDRLPIMLIHRKSHSRDKVVLIEK